MKKVFLGLMTVVSVSSAHAYTLNLESNAVFANRKCTLELGKKVYQKAQLADRFDYMVQEAVITTKVKRYTFELKDARQTKDQTNFGMLADQTISTHVLIKKVGDEAISVKAITEDWHGRTDVEFDCGIMVAK